MLLVGFLLAFVLRNPFLSYLSVFLTGFLAGRVYYQKHKSQPILPFILITLGFFIGIIVGSVFVSRWLVVFFFVVGAVLSNYLHRRGFFWVDKSRKFLR